jgi:hypothetical protein
MMKKVIHFNHNLLVYIECRLLNGIGVKNILNTNCEGK